MKICNFRNSNFFKGVSKGIIFVLLLSFGAPPSALAQVSALPEPGAMVSMSPEFMPVMMKGLKVHPENPLLFDFIFDTGRSGLKADGVDFRSESEKAIKYFLASLTIPERDLWVNLSPYEKDRMLTEELGQTTLGEDMLAQDYILKQLTASLLYPEKELGKAFWDRVYAQAREKFGAAAADIPVDTFNKVWITADKANVLERNGAAYVVGAHLKVMIESDYLAESMEHGAVGADLVSARIKADIKSAPTQELAKEVLRGVIIPQIEKEVNTGANFVPLRQMFHAMILSAWYKRALKSALLNQVYSDRGKTGGVLSDDPDAGQQIYARYLEAYRKGVFNYIKEMPSGPEGESVPRKYFSGGLALGVDKAMKVVSALGPEDHARAVGETVQVTATMDPAQGGKITTQEFRIAALLGFNWNTKELGTIKEKNLSPVMVMRLLAEFSGHQVRMGSEDNADRLATIMALEPAVFTPENPEVSAVPGKILLQAETDKTVSVTPVDLLKVLALTAERYPGVLQQFLFEPFLIDGVPLRAYRADMVFPVSEARGGRYINALLSGDKWVRIEVNKPEAKAQHQLFIDGKLFSSELTASDVVGYQRGIVAFTQRVSQKEPVVVVNVAGEKIRRFTKTQGRTYSWGAYPSSQGTYLASRFEGGTWVVEHYRPVLGPGTDIPSSMWVDFDAFRLLGEGGKPRKLRRPQRGMVVQLLDGTTWQIKSVDEDSLSAWGSVYRLAPVALGEPGERVALEDAVMPLVLRGDDAQNSNGKKEQQLLAELGLTDNARALTALDKLKEKGFPSLFVLNLLKEFIGREVSSRDTERNPLTQLIKDSSLDLGEPLSGSTVPAGMIVLPYSLGQRGGAAEMGAPHDPLDFPVDFSLDGVREESPQDEEPSVEAKYALTPEFFLELLAAAADVTTLEITAFLTGRLKVGAGNFQAVLDRGAYVIGDAGGEDQTIVFLDGGSWGRLSVRREKAADPFSLFLNGHLLNANLSGNDVVAVSSGTIFVTQTLSPESHDPVMAWRLEKDSPVRLDAEVLKRHVWGTFPTAFGGMTTGSGISAQGEWTVQHARPLREAHQSKQPAVLTLDLAGIAADLEGRPFNSVPAVEEGDEFFRADGTGLHVHAVIADPLVPGAESWGARLYETTTTDEHGPGEFSRDDNFMETILALSPGGGEKEARQDASIRRRIQRVQLVDDELSAAREVVGDDALTLEALRFLKSHKWDVKAVLQLIRELFGKEISAGRAFSASWAYILAEARPGEVSRSPESKVGRMIFSYRNHTRYVEPHFFVQMLARAASNKPSTVKDFLNSTFLLDKQYVLHVAFGPAAFRVTDALRVAGRRPYFLAVREGGMLRKIELKASEGQFRRWALVADGEVLSDDMTREDAVGYTPGALAVTRRLLKESPVAVLSFQDGRWVAADSGLVGGNVQGVPLTPRTRLDRNRPPLFTADGRWEVPHQSEFMVRGRLKPLRLSVRMSLDVKAVLAGRNASFLPEAPTYKTGLPVRVDEDTTGVVFAVHVPAWGPPGYIIKIAGDPEQVKVKDLLAGGLLFKDQAWVAEHLLPGRSEETGDSAMTAQQAELQNRALGLRMKLMRVAKYERPVIRMDSPDTSDPELETVSAVWQEFLSDLEQVRGVHPSAGSLWGLFEGVGVDQVRALYRLRGQDVYGWLQDLEGAVKDWDKARPVPAEISPTDVIGRMELVQALIASGALTFEEDGEGYDVLDLGHPHFSDETRVWEAVEAVAGSLRTGNDPYVLTEQERAVLRAVWQRRSSLVITAIGEIGAEQVLIVEQAFLADDGTGFRARVYDPDAQSPDVSVSGGSQLYWELVARSDAFVYLHEEQGGAARHVLLLESGYYDSVERVLSAIEAVADTILVDGFQGLTAEDLRAVRAHWAKKNLGGGPQLWLSVTGAPGSPQLRIEYQWDGAFQNLLARGWNVFHLSVNAASVREARPAAEQPAWRQLDVVRPEEPLQGPHIFSPGEGQDDPPEEEDGALPVFLGLFTGEDNAMADARSLTKGGIDLNAGKLDLGVDKDNSLEMGFDPRLAEAFRQGDFSGIAPHIIRIVPVADPLLSAAPLTP
jgi:hypothetical protein